MNTIAQFSVNYLQFINKESVIVRPLPSFAKDQNNLIDVYRSMLLTRILDHKAVALQRTGQMGTYPSSLGQEAVSVGMAYAMHPNDILVPYYRDQGAMIQRGVKITELLAYWGGDERGNRYSTKSAHEDFPISIPVGSQCLHAVGVAYAIQYKQETRAVICSCGDGGTSKGDFYESLNFAGVKKLPVVFVINNNQWAISVPRTLQTAAETLAQKAIATGFNGIQVDGNDIVAVQFAVNEALIKARQNQGPTLIEAVTYRLSDHTTADNAKRYWDEKTVKNAWQYEPLNRIKNYLLTQNILSEKKEHDLEEECTAQVDKAINEYTHTLMPALTDMFDYLYEKLPEELKEQRNQFISRDEE